MVAAVLLGVAGFLCAIFLSTVLGAYALLDSILPGMPHPGLWHRLLAAAGAGHRPRRAALCRAGLQSFYRLLSCWPSSGIRFLWRAAPAGPG